VDAVTVDPFGHQLLGQFLGCRFTGGVTVVGDQYPLGVMRLEGLQVIGGKTFDAVAGGRLPVLAVLSARRGCGPWAESSKILSRTVLMRFTHRVIFAFNTSVKAYSEHAHTL
jgi:hypothetical protein